MSRSVNQVVLLGNLTRDPELRQTPSGQDVANFSIALNRTYKKDDELVETTDYVDIVAWGKLAGVVYQYLKSGSKALVEGRLQSRSWETDGVKKSKLEVLANDVIFLDSKETTNE